MDLVVVDEKYVKKFIYKRHKNDFSKNERFLFYHWKKYLKCGSLETISLEDDKNCIGYANVIRINKYIYL